MTTAPEFSIDAQAFWHDPYPALAEMRRAAPICFVPELGATLMTRRDDIFTCEKNIDVFSSDQPGGLMTLLMGENMMRKDGEAHLNERKQIFLSVSPRTVRDVWKAKFEADTAAVLDDISKRGSVDLVRDFAMPVCGHALRHMTGLTNLRPQQIDQTSQAMIDGCANYSGDHDTETRCKAATNLLDNAMEERLVEVADQPDHSMLSILSLAGQPQESIRANVKLAISGGQNEPRDAIAGCVWALLIHPNELAKVKSGEATWRHVFEEFARWISPIGMSPRRIAKQHTWNGIDLEPESRLFFMFGSANRDELVFEKPDIFDISRDTAKAISFGAGPHFCAGAAASRTLIAEVALPMLFDRFPNMKLANTVEFGGWAFRGPLKVLVSL